jgi:hypothetical protein
VKGISLNTILLIALAVFITLQLNSCFSSSPKIPDISDKLKAKDELIEEIRGQRIEDRKLIDSMVSLLSKQDEQKVREIKTIVTKYEQVPANINSLDREKLRAAAIAQ